MPATFEEDWEFWDQKVTDLSRTELDTVQKSATAWKALVGGLIGLFGTIAFVSGPSSLAKLPDDTAMGVRVITVVALLVAVVATVFLARASATLYLADVEALDGDDLREGSKSAARTNLTRLRIGRVLGIIAACLVMIGSLIVFIGPEKQSASDTSVVVVVGGSATCGKLDLQSSELVAGEQSLAEGVDSITVVDECPSG